MSIRGQVAATPEVGVQPYKSYSGGAIDHIQMQNGQAYIRIPLVSFPQLGKLSLSFSLLANGSTWSPISYCDPNYGPCTYTYGLTYISGQQYAPGAPVINFFMGSGGGSVTPIDDQVLNYCESTLYDLLGDGADCSELFVSCIPGNMIDPIYRATPDYDVFDETGAAHAMGFSGTDYSKLYATDGSGYKLSLNRAPDIDQADSEPTTYTITEPSGITHATTPNQTIISDLNGNHISIVNNSSATTITDSVGRSFLDLNSADPPTNSSTTGCPDLQIPGQPATGAIAWQVPGPNGQSVTYLFCGTSVPISTNFYGLHGGSVTNCNISTDANGDTICLYVTFSDISTTNDVLQSVVLPNGTYWGFGYDTTATGPDRYGDLTFIRLPSGGTIQYTYGMIQECGWANGESGYPQGRAILQRIASPLTGPAISRTYSYGATQTVETDAEGNQTVHNFTLDYPTTPMCGAAETSTQWYQGAASSSNVPRKSETITYMSTLDPQDDFYNTYRGYINRLPTTKTTLQDGQPIKTESYGYDSVFTDTEPFVEYDGGSGAYTVGLSPTTANIYYQTPSTVDDGIQVTATQRLVVAQPAYAAVNVINLPQAVAVCASGSSSSACLNSPQSKTTYGYDEAGSPQGLYGNLTSVRKLFSGGQDPITSTVFNSVGMPISTTDPLGNQGTSNHVTSYNYDNSGLYVVAVNRPSTNGVNHTSYYAQDFNTGVVTAMADENASSIADGAHRTSFGYDSVGRLTSVQYPDGGGITQCYTDEGGPSCSLSSPPFSVLTTKIESFSQNVTSAVGYDGLGRSLTLTAPNGAVTTTTYDIDGQVNSVSNPQFSTPSPTDGTTIYTYDALGRKKVETRPDQNSLNWSYNGNTVTFSDETNRSWVHISDARGRLTSVIEPGNIPTTYGYDPLDNLLSVTQNGVSGETPRIRSFVYDSLSRLTSATNPETGTISYNYDPNGNLHQKTDARGIWTAYAYDAVNRLTDKSFGDGLTPNQHFRYDQTSTWMGANYNSIGRLSESYTDWDMRYFGGGSPPACNPQSSATANYNPANGNPTYCNWTDELFSYDPMGRLIRSRSAFPSESGWNAHEIDLTYDLAGNLASLTYPDGRVVTQTFDGAGRLQSSTFDNWNGQHVGYTYAAGFTYTAAGAVAEMTQGNGIYTHTPYNNRLQKCQVWVQTPTQPLIDTHIYFGGSTNYCSSTPGNNGNITQIKDWRNPNHTRYFGYDALNRINAFSNAEGNMQQSYSYDSFGNMSQTGTLSFSSSPLSNNQIGASGYAYDAAGNLTSVNNVFTSTYSFDAESKIFRINAGTGYYTYDADGERMRKDASGGYTEYQYLNGQPIAEKNSDGTWSDYIYANGQKIARADSFDTAIHVHGTSPGNTLASWQIAGGANYIVKANDTLYLRQLQYGAYGGPNVQFTGGNGQTYGITSDSSGQPISAESTQGQWVTRKIDLSAFAGLQVSDYQVVTDGSTPAGTYDIYYADIVIVSDDGTVTPIFTRQQGATFPLAANGGQTNLSAAAEVSNVTANAVQPTTTTTYYHGDQIGSTRLLTSGGGWPVSSDMFYPFGQEQNPTTDPNHYKFTGKERDTESGLDYFGARYYGSSMGRWMSPDWADKPEAVPYSSLDNPQSLNLYGYVLNNPLSKADPDGHAGCPPDCGDPTAPTNVSAPTPSLFSRFVDANVSFLHSAAVLYSDLMNPTKNCPQCSMQMVPLGMPEEAPGILQNAAQGRAFQEAVVAQTAVTDTNVVQNVTIKTESGVKTVMDVVSKDASGNVALTEAKSSATARLTPNQAAAHPEIAQTGGTVVGQGKPGFPGGTKIPPARVC